MAKSKWAALIGTISLLLRIHRTQAIPSVLALLAGIARPGGNGDWAFLASFPLPTFGTRRPSHIGELPRYRAV